MRLLEGNVQLTHKSDKITSPPPTCLKQEDFKNSYSVTIPDKAYTYFNYSTIDLSSQEILKIMTDIAIKASLNIFNKQKEAKRMYSKNDFNQRDILISNPEVYTYSELYNSLDKSHQSTFKEKQKNVLKNKKLTLQEKGIKIVEILDDLSGDKGGRIILSFLPPYYPAIIMNEVEEQNIIEVRNKVAKYAREEFKVELTTAEVFPGISDLSYFNLKNYKKETGHLKPNLPFTGYKLPLKEMNQLNIPVMNLGVYGKDIHKYTERIEKTYSFKILPNLLIKVIDLLLK